MALRALKTLKAGVWFAVVAAVAVVLIAPMVYLYESQKLPALESEFDLERALRNSIESERRSQQMGKYDPKKDPIEWKRPDFARLPKNLVAAYISERGCPTYFQTPREDGWAWAKRLMLGLVNVEPPGDGWCEQVFASNLATRIGAKGTMQTVVATHKIHRFLKKDALVAYDLHSLKLEVGVVGVEAAADTLFHKPLLELSLSELAELALAIPPNSAFEQIKQCKNSVQIRQARDGVLDRLKAFSLIPDNESRLAKDQELACKRPN